MYLLYIVVYYINLYVKLFHWPTNCVGRTVAHLVVVVAVVNAWRKIGCALRFGTGASPARRSFVSADILAV